MEDIYLQLVAGATAGAISDTITHPLSTIKTRLQCQGAASALKGSTVYSGPYSAFVSIVRTEGFMSLYKGVIARDCFFAFKNSVGLRITSIHTGLLNAIFPARVSPSPNRVNDKALPQ